MTKLTHTHLSAPLAGASWVLLLLIIKLLGAQALASFTHWINFTWQNNSTIACLCLVPMWWQPTMRKASITELRAARWLDDASRCVDSTWLNTADNYKC